MVISTFTAVFTIFSPLSSEVDFNDDTSELETVEELIETSDFGIFHFQTCPVLGSEITTVAAILLTLWFVIIAFLSDA